MGQFFSIALVDSSLTKTKNEVANFSNKSQGEYKDMPGETIEENNILYSKVKSLAQTKSAVLFPIFNQDFYNCSQYISDRLETKVLTVHIHDSDAWLLYLFDKGIELTRFLSDPEKIGEKKENWMLDFDTIEAKYGVSRAILNRLDGTGEKEFSNADFGIDDEMFDFLHLLNYPIGAIKNYDTGYRHIISGKELKRLTKTFLTVEDLKKTKKYSVGLLALDKELADLFYSEIEFMESCKVCQKCRQTTINNEYFLNIDVLCVQLYGECTTCGLEKRELLMNYGFIHKMEEIRDYLNK